MDAEIATRVRRITAAVRHARLYIDPTPRPTKIVGRVELGLPGTNKIWIAGFVAAAEERTVTMVLIRCLGSPPLAQPHRALPSSRETPVEGEAIRLIIPDQAPATVQKHRGREYWADLRPGDFLDVMCGAEWQGAKESDGEWFWRAAAAAPWSHHIDGRLPDHRRQFVAALDLALGLLP